MDILSVIFASGGEDSDEEKDRMGNVDEMSEPPAVSVSFNPGPDVKPPPANAYLQTQRNKPKDTDEGKQKQKKKGSKGGAPVSFDVDEDGGESFSLTG
ncbi:hypothetical protein DFJ58DRAFT_726538 [Suillus subalutaceus]|uniref:uncharacterized protein n=1 Tax=Suillus subalutaceus TaxID=48586 RepID=UPI001B86DFFA|nr:uncharacterized protein DFJ58DRAFT_726538 [Suillus subalutaceus]KAG1858750.1 hypothetical protein DFJ58DRAFT_726538 [Suillus subalutaceus]